LKVKSLEKQNLIGFEELINFITKERKKMKINLNNIQIDKRSELSAYITIGDWIIYLDNSTGEHIIDTWKEGDHESVSSS